MQETKLKIKLLKEEFSICKVDDLSQVSLTDEFVFISKTDEEISLVCKYNSVPSNTTVCNDGWRAFRLEGELDFSLTGILSKLSSLLAEKQISIFAISTYNTDYILVKIYDLEKAIAVLQYRGYEIII